MSATHTDIVGSLDNAPVREWALHLGPDDHIVGVISLPGVAAARPVAAAARPMMLFLNAGVIHRVGPHRLHVTLARRLAARGVMSLRLDLSGIGDSRQVPGALSFRESAVADTRSAMDRLRAETGAERFVLFGLCSGADNALATATADERVVGIVLLDPPAYATRRSRARKVVSTVRRLGSVRAVVGWAVPALARRVRARIALARRPSRRDDDDQDVSGGRETPPLDAYRSQLGALVERGVAILAIFSGAHGERYNDADQLFELFPELRGRVDIGYFPEANHTFTELDGQAKLTSIVCSWVNRWS